MNSFAEVQYLKEVDSSLKSSHPENPKLTTAESLSGESKSLSYRQMRTGEWGRPPARISLQSDQWELIKGLNKDSTIWWCLVVTDKKSRIIYEAIQEGLDDSLDKDESF